MKITEKILSDLSDNSELLDYINSLESSIEEYTDEEKKIDTILENILSKFDNFKDIRSLRASNISAITELIKTKHNMRESKIDKKKALLDLVMKKRNNDARNSTTLAINQDTKIDIGSLLIKLDELNIHPIIDKKLLEESGSLIETEIESLNSGSSIKIALNSGIEETEQKLESTENGGEKD